MAKSLVSCFFDSRCRIVFAQMCILLYYWANKMMMVVMTALLRLFNDLFVACSFDLVSAQVVLFTAALNQRTSMTSMTAKLTPLYDSPRIE